MTLQEAYNKGLDDAESVVISQLVNLIRENKMDEFNNPKLNAIREILLEWSGYFHKHSKQSTFVGKRHKKMLISQYEKLDKSEL